MNPTIDLLMKRKSVRVYDARPITPEDEETILSATLRAPTAGNMMLYSIIRITDPMLKEHLAESCDHQPFIAKAPLLLLFLADYQRWYDYYLAGGVLELCREKNLAMRIPQEGDLLLAICDTLIAAQTAVVAAEALGIGSCYIGDILERFEEHRALFNLPQYVLPVTLITFGYPTPAAANRALTPRFDRRCIVSENGYRHLQPSELDEMFSGRNAQYLASANHPADIANVAQFNYVRKFSADFSVELTRSVRAMLASWTHNR